jgi:hypothetical protein
MKIVHVDGGTFSEPPDYKFHDAYFSVVSDSGELIHFAKNIGDLWSGLAEYEAIKWAVKNIQERPLKVYSDCTVAIGWAKHGSSKKSKCRVQHLPLNGVTFEFKHGNFADQWNAANHSPKKDKSFYSQRYYSQK